jgi:F0F1-type ATP synthase membrane subunit b/b'
MDTGVIIAIVAAALILLAVLWFAARAGRERRYEARRNEAREIRREADVGSAQADRTRAEAEAQAAEARRQEALARERAASAEELDREARDRHIEAARKDPDADPDEVAAQFDRDQHTTEPGIEREGRFERDADGNVVRNDEYEQPRTER